MKCNDFSLHCTAGETEVNRDHLTWPKNENSSGTELGESPRPSPWVHQPDQSAEEDSSGQGCIVAGACSLVFFGAEAHVITS